LRLEVPYFKQEKSITCGPACVRMVTAYNNILYSEIKLEDACETSWLGNTCEELASGAQKLGFMSTVLENITLDTLKDSLEKGVPIIALLDPSILYGGISGFGHFVVIIGLEKDAIYYHDPDFQENLAEKVHVFFNAWEKYSFKGLKIWKSLKK